MRPDNADTAKERVFKALLQRPHNSVELSQPHVGGLRFGARIMELRKEGIHIVTEEIPGKSIKLYSIQPRKGQLPLFGKTG